MIRRWVRGTLWVAYDYHNDEGQARVVSIRRTGKTSFVICAALVLIVGAVSLLALIDNALIRLALTFIGSLTFFWILDRRRIHGFQCSADPELVNRCEKLVPDEGVDRWQPVPASKHAQVWSVYRAILAEKI